MFNSVVRIFQYQPNRLVRLMSPGLSPAGLGIISDIEWPTAVDNDFETLTLHVTVDHASYNVIYVKDT